MSPSESQERLDRLRESADASARNFRTVYVSYLVIALYILVIISSTTHELLFRAGDVQAPIINVGVPVVWFFTFVPWILLFLHFNLLLQGIFLSRKVRAFRSAVRRWTPAAGGRDEQLDLLFPAPLAHMVGGGDSRRGTRFLLSAMVVISVAFLPLVILIYAQVQFLPYQAEAITWMHRVVVIVDFTLLWWLWPRLTAPGKRWREWWDGSRRYTGGGWLTRSSLLRSVRNLSAALTGAAILFIIAVAEVPGGAVDGLWPLRLYRDALGRIDLRHQILLEREPPPEFLANSDRFVEPGSSEWCRYAKPLKLRDRNFRRAKLVGVTLCGAVLTEAKLQGADFSWAKLHGANLQQSKLHGANLGGTELQGANLSLAKLHGANLQWSQLDGADLLGTELQGVNLSSAKLHGANLRNAELHGANLQNAELYGANLLETELHGANLSWAKLHGANLRQSKLHGADLRWAELHGADLTGASMVGISLLGTDLMLSDLSDINLTDAPDWDALFDEVSKKITAGETKASVLERLGEAEQSETDIAPRSIKNAIIGRNYELARGLGELTQEQNYFSPDHEAEYLDMLRLYLASDLACRDSKGYVALGIARRVMFGGASGLILALKESSCPETIETGLAMLPSIWRDVLNEVAARVKAAEEQQ